MTRLNQLFSYFEDRPWSVVDLLRIYLGVGLLVRGTLFIGNRSLLTGWLMEAGEMQLWAGLAAHYVVVAHLAGGILLALGLVTRIAALAQIPILVGAVFFVHLEEGLFTTNPDQSLEFSVLVLFLLIIIFLWGAGPLSVDHYLKESADGEEALERPLESPEVS
jgi:uncharacterized membrane protein YphA (DoxX/SURF4 family)